MATDQTHLDELCINTIRFLSADAVQKAKSGHPGAPMGAAACAYTLWDRFMRYCPTQPDWPDRDRFLLSAGHASMLLYSLLYLTGYSLTLDDIKQFRQWGSRTPGHPEAHHPGVEVTTGPLGQGFGNGVGMAIAEKWLAARFNRPGHDIIDHYTYVLCSDGDLQEGVSSESASLAGTLNLGKLICLYDDNGVQLDGPTRTAFTENVKARFQAYGWQVIGPIDGMSVPPVERAIELARAETAAPSLIMCGTVIGYGATTAGTSKTHGEPLGEDVLRGAKEKLGWPLEPSFYVPEAALDRLRQAMTRGERLMHDWHARVEAYEQEYPVEAAELQMALAGALPVGWDEGLDGLFPPGSAPVATRNAAGTALNLIATRVKNLVGGSADLASSTRTMLTKEENFSAATPAGRNLHFGVREHAMGAIANGLGAHGGVIPYAGTFLTFSDYMRPPIRLAAMSKLRVIYVFTHDSIALGQDGPTHQPIEQLAGLRSVPNLTLIRPADAAETVEAWRAALLNTGGPTALALTRQNLPELDRANTASASGMRQGGYVLWESSPEPRLILIATGSEVHLCLQAGRQLAADGVAVRVVSLPSWELFDQQPAEYRETVLPRTVAARLAVEAGVPMGWERYVGARGDVLGIDTFGASAPGEVVMAEYGFTVENVVARAKALLG